MASSNYSTYERELKSILEAETSALKRYRRTATTPGALEALDKLEQRPFLVVRAAGSHGFDLVALRGSLSLPIEVKCSGESVIRFASSRGRNQEQYHQLLAHTRKSGLALLYAYRLVGGTDEDPWRLFSVGANGGVSGSPTEGNGPIGGIAGIVARGTPAVSMSPQGNIILRWSEGRRLTDLLSWVATLP